jgi:uncharacterized protein (TIGR02646 family)
MRYISMSDLEALEGWPPGMLEHLKHLRHRKQTPEKWRADLRQAQNELRNLPPGKTYSDIFKKYSYLWSDVKEYYRHISHEKCWYCETKTDRMRGDIDHYRPKGGVIQNPDHPGYWWLAFEWRNWRFACELCNSKLTDYATGLVGGKGSAFPLVGDDESRRICNECDYEDLFAEDPALLDPTEPQDPQLLSFTSDGRPGPITNDEKSIEYQRVETSIRAYHLDHHKLNRERQTLYYKVLKLVTIYRKYDALWQTNRSDLGSRACAREAYANLRALIAPKAPYSAAARAYLKEHRKENPQWHWVDQLLTDP